MRGQPRDRSDGAAVPVLYLAPWVDIGGSDTSTIDWFRFLDRDRYRASMITTQPSPGRKLGEIQPYADELWELPELTPGNAYPDIVLSFIHTRKVRVVHIMNSRLGFELLPEIATLAEPPVVVVQFHGEEQDRRGYVRPVTTRYGNLVHAFSLTTATVVERLRDYGIPPGKCRVIPIGVDARSEFSPDHVRPVEGLEPGVFHIAFPARLTAQKDPLLMVEVAARLRAGGLPFRLHVLGDGDLSAAVTERVTSLGLEREVQMRGAIRGVAPWYAACDAALLTSAYETSPTRVAYEAMAMGVPLVAPDFPEMSELVGPDTGVLVHPREDPAAYAKALSGLAREPERRREIGAAARALIVSSFSVERMATEHAALYDELLARVPAPSRRTDQPPSAAPPAAFRNRRPSERPLVSVIVTCFNNGYYLDSCLESVAQQDYEPLETIVVDDASTDPDTIAAVAAVQRSGAAKVLRLRHNRGPAGARNAGIERATGRYILPLDCDDMLVEDAIAGLVQQLASAGERIGFVYPNIQYFGNRNDYYEAPSYNLYALLNDNYCASSCLFDREVFDQGQRYREVGHEDWDLTLTLAEHRIYGEPAHGPTLLCRRQGFTRNALMDVATDRRDTPAMHPRLLSARAEIKAEWNPAVSVVALDPLEDDGEDRLEARLVRAVGWQSCSDFELIVRPARELGPTELGRRLRSVPSALARSRAQALADGLKISRGRFVLAVYGSPSAVLCDPALVEKLLRVLGTNVELAALALACAGPGRVAMRLLDTDAVSGATLVALCFATIGSAAPPASLMLEGARPLETLARWIGVHGSVQWRHLEVDVPATSDEQETIGDGARLSEPRQQRARDRAARNLPPELPRHAPAPACPSADAGRWRAAQTRLLCRHVELPSGRYVYTNWLAPPSGCRFEHVLGCVRAFPFPETAPLLIADEGRFELGAVVEIDDPALLGFVDRQPLPLLESLNIGRLRETGQLTLVTGGDPLGGAVDEMTCIGYLEPYPIYPHAPPHLPVSYGLRGLVRSVDLAARRHRYGAGVAPPGLPAGELGALFAGPTGDCEPIWIDEQGHVYRQDLSHRRPTVADAVRWSGAPLTWTGFSHLKPKLRATARRTYESVHALIAAPAAISPPARPAGYLLREPTAATVPLYGSVHPVTGDHLLSTTPAEPESLGYDHVELLGHLVAQAPVTGSLGAMRPPAPWTSRFGQIDDGP